MSWTKALEQVSISEEKSPSREDGWMLFDEVKREIEGDTPMGINRAHKFVKAMIEQNIVEVRQMPCYDVRGRKTLKPFYRLVQ